MATIHIARVIGDVGFSRIVAAKRLQPQLAEDAEFVAMFLDEARIASKIHHRNVVPVLDVVALGNELVLVQEYVHGVPLSWLLRRALVARQHVPIDVSVSIGCQILAGLHAAHETVDELGAPLHVVHRDVSPQNIMISTDGTARLLDFGIAKASDRASVTRKGYFKGKLGYSAPEQVDGRATRKSDVYALSIVLWELLVGRRFHRSGQSDTELINEIVAGSLPTITEALAGERSWLGAARWSELEELEPILQLGLSQDPRLRWPTAAAMEKALASAVMPAPTSAIAAWVAENGKEFIDRRDRAIAEDEVSYRRITGALPRLGSSEDAPPVPAVATEHTRWRWLNRQTATIAAGGLLVFALAFGAAALVRGHAGGPAPPPPAEEPGGIGWWPPAMPAAAAAATDPSIAPPMLVPPRAPEVCPPSRPIVVPIEAPPNHNVNVVKRRPPPPPHKSAKADCTTPYYFRGQKKIFKPQCI